MPRHFQIMSTLSARDVAHQPVLAMQMEDRAPMNDWVGEARVSCMTAQEEVDSRRCNPFLRLNVRQGRPGKRALGNRLVQAVNSKRVMGARPAKLVARMMPRFW